MRVFTASKRRVDPRVIIALVALIAVLYYIITCAFTFRVGFPLDDAWIHFTYARNLAEHGQWAFRLGERSAASTSPFWTFLLGIGFFLKLAPYIWTFFLGWVVLTLIGIRAEETARQLIPTYRPNLPWVGIFFVVAWHLTWAAVSGMETLLHGYLILVVLTMLLTRSPRYLAMGLVAGFSIWVRPDGLTLLGPLLFTAFVVETGLKSRAEAIFKILIGFGALFVPYLLFNLALSGNPMPNTFYAKQAEYQTYWLSQPFSNRITDYLWPVIASPFLVLLPAALVWISRKVVRRDWAVIATVLWFIGYIAIYFMRLPAYQHGRYIIPAFPIMYLWGILGMIEIISSPAMNQRFVLTWQILLGTVCILFSVMAAHQNAVDVYWIETEMVQAANWVKKNIPPDKLLAVHDIGALGYYVPNPMIDLAGLVTPDVIPFIRDSAKLSEYLNTKSADYLIVFPRQYINVIGQRKPIFISQPESNILDIQDFIEIYQWK
jgi:hypothetical protein